MAYNQDEKYMAATLALSRRYWGLSAPNPAVGALLVKHGRIVGQGVHKQPGQLHGEALALAQAGPEARGAVLYVNLEPCRHYGRTPPCTEAIVRAGVKRVVYGASDPGPQAGGGGAILASQGVEVTSGVLREQCEREHRLFLTHQRLGRPYVILKSAVSMDGRIATVSGQSQWITGQQSRAKAHWLRGRMQAVMVGINTVRADDPRLTCRLPGHPRQPLRVILDSRLSLPLQAKVLDEPGQCLVACSGQADAAKVRQLEERGAAVWPMGETVDVAGLLQRLGRQGISSLMLEGGGEVNFSLLAADLVDELWLFMAPLLIGGRGAPAFVGGAGFAALDAAARFAPPAITRLGPDVLLRAMRSR